MGRQVVCHSFPTVPLSESVSSPVLQPCAFVFVQCPLLHPFPCLPYQDSHLSVVSDSSLSQVFPIVCSLYHARSFSSWFSSLHITLLHVVVMHLSYTLSAQCVSLFKALQFVILYSVFLLVCLFCFVYSLRGLRFSLITESHRLQKCKSFVLIQI